PLKRDIADREHFVNDQHFRFEMCGDRKGKPHIHSARVVLDRCVKKRSDLGKLDDLIELSLYLRAFHTEDRTVKKDVLAAAQFSVKSGADRQQTAEAAADLRPPGGRFCDPCEDLEERGFPCTVVTNDAKRLT